MVSYLEGTIIEKDSSSVIVLTNGVGYRVFISNSLAQKYSKGAPCSFYTHYVVRETSAELFGFASFEELVFFEKLISVSGVGPKTALSLFGASSLEKLKGAIVRGDAGLFKAVSGVGPKTAERIVIELRDKIGKEEYVSDSPGDQDITDALIALGYSNQDAVSALKKVDTTIDNEQERLKAALKMLGNRK